MESAGGASEHLGGGGEVFGGDFFTFGVDDDGAFFAFGFGLFGDGAFHVVWEGYVFEFYTLDINAPGFRSFVNHGLNFLGNGFEVTEELV